MRTIFIFFLICLTVALDGYGQTGSLQVLDNVTDAPINTAVLEDEKGFIVEKANEKGVLSRNPGGKTVAAPGYKTYSLHGDKTVVRLLPLSIQLGEVVAEGLRPKNFALQDVRITGDRGIPIIGQGQAPNLGQDIPYLVQQTPSAITTSDAGAGVGYTSLRIRGSDATRTNVTLDGIPVNDAESQGTFWVNLPDLASSVGTVTVVRGVGSSTSGPGAFGAGLLLQTRQPSDTAFVTVDNSVGSFNTRRHSLQIGTGTFGKGFSAEARLSRIASDGYIDRASSDMQSYMAVLRYKSQSGFTARLLHTSGREKTYQAWYGVERRQADTMRTFNSAGTDFGQRAQPYENEIDNYRQDYWQLHFGSPIGKEWKLGGAFFYTFGQGYYEQYKVQDALANYGFQFRDTIPPPTDLVRRRWLRNHYFGFTGSVQYEARRHSLTIGTLLSSYLGESFGRIIWGQSTFIPGPDWQYHHNNSSKQEASAFAKYTYTLPSGISLYADAQIRMVTYGIAGLESGNVNINLDKEWLFFNPKAGIGYDGGSFGRFFLSAAVAQREPTRTTLTDSRGGIDPRPELLVDYEFSYQTRIGSLRPEVNLYYMNYRDQLVQTGELNDVGNAIFKNTSKSYRAGVELQLTYNPTKKWILSGSVTFSRNQIRAVIDTLIDGEGNLAPTTFKNRAIAYSPAFSSQGRVTYLPYRGFEATLLARYIGKQFLDNRQLNTFSLPGYGLVDLRLAYSLPKVRFARALQVTLQLNNVLNASYSNNGYVYADVVYIYPQAGTNFLAGLLVSF